MIDVSEFEFKLTLLRQYMFAKIDGHVPQKKHCSFLRDIGAVPELPWEEVIRIYNQTGILFYREDDNLCDVTFDEYCTYKMNDPIILC